MSLVYSMGRGVADRVRSEEFLDGRFTIRSNRGVRPAERLLVERLDKADRGDVLDLGSREGLLAAAVRSLYPEARVSAWGWDVHEYDAARAVHEANQVAGVAWQLAPVPWEGDVERFDRVLLPLPGDQELDFARELVHHAHRLLKVGGLLLVSVESKRAGALDGYVRKCFASLSSEEGSHQGRVWLARRKAADRPPGAPGFAPYTVREGDLILSFVSRPGVFAHGRLDEGARALLKVLEVRPDDDAILDLGCGAGELGIVAAVRAPGATVVLADSSTRAIQCAERNAEGNVPGRWKAVLTADPGRDVEGSFSLALLNPPYYANQRISEVFLDAALRRLRPGGRMVLVTKLVDWHREAIRASFRLDEEVASLGYAVFFATRS